MMRLMSKGDDLTKCERADRLRMMIYDALRYRYGTDPLIEVRVQEEWEAIVRCGAVNDVAVLYDLVCWFKKRGVPYVMRYTAGASLILYLLGITRGNPMPLHGYCSVCRRVYWDKNEDVRFHCGVDGAALLSDGYDISWQSLWGYDGSFLRFSIDLPTEYYEDVIAYLTTHMSSEGECGGVCMSEEDGVKRVVADRIICTFALDMTDTYFDDIEQMLKDDSFEKISFREDIYRWLLSYGFNREEAWLCMERVRKGRGLPSDIAERIGIHDTRMRARCEEVVYLPSKAHITEEFLFKIDIL